MICQKSEKESLAPGFEPTQKKMKHLRESDDLEKNALLILITF